MPYKVLLTGQPDITAVVVQADSYDPAGDGFVIFRKGISPVAAFPKARVLSILLIDGDGNCAGEVVKPKQTALPIPEKVFGGNPGGVVHPNVYLGNDTTALYSHRLGGVISGPHLYGDKNDPPELFISAETEVE